MKKTVKRENTQRVSNIQGMFNIRRMLWIAALAAAMIFSLAACDNGTTSDDSNGTGGGSGTEGGGTGTGGGNGNGGGSGTGGGNDTGGNGTGGGNNNGGGGSSGYLISGKFASRTGTGDAVFYADYVSGAGSVSLAAGGMAATEKEISGKIQDGQVIFDITGVYGTAAGKFFLSAGGSGLIYQLAGTLSSTGVVSNASAAVATKEGDDWVIHDAAAVTAAADVEIPGPVSAAQIDGLPPAWFGTWESNTGEQVIFTAFQYILPGYPDFPMWVVDTVAITAGQKYETVWVSGMVYEGNAGPGGVGEPPILVGLEYTKYVIEADGSNLKMISYPESVSETFAAAKAYVIKVDSPADSAIVHRPGSGQ